MKRSSQGCGREGDGPSPLRAFRGVDGGSGRAPVDQGHEPDGPGRRGYQAHEMGVPCQISEPQRAKGRHRENGQEHDRDRREEVAIQVALLTRRGCGGGQKRRDRGHEEFTRSRDDSGFGGDHPAHGRAEDEGGQQGGSVPVRPGEGGRRVRATRGRGVGDQGLGMGGSCKGSLIHERLRSLRPGGSGQGDEEKGWGSIRPRRAGRPGSSRCCPPGAPKQSPALD